MEKGEFVGQGKQFLAKLEQTSKGLETQEKTEIQLDASGLATLFQTALFADFNTLREIGFNVPPDADKNSFVSINKGKSEAGIGYTTDGKATPVAKLSVTDFEGKIVGNPVKLNQFSLMVRSAPYKEEQIELVAVDVVPNISLPVVGKVKDALWQNFHHEFIMWPIEEGVKHLFALQNMTPPKGVGLTINAKEGSERDERSVSLVLYKNKEMKYPITTVLRGILAAKGVQV
jgi:hypothetical protein